LLELPLAASELNPIMCIMELISKNFRNIREVKTTDQPEGK